MIKTQIECRKPQKWSSTRVKPAAGMFMSHENMTEIINTLSITLKQRKVGQADSGRHQNVRLYLDVDFSFL